MKHVKWIPAFEIILICMILFGCQSRNIANTAAAPDQPAVETSRIADNTPIPGWNQYSSGRFSMSLPESYIGGNSLDDLDFLAKRVEELGPEFAQSVETMKQNQHQFIIWAIDSRVNLSGGLTNVTVMANNQLSGLTIEQIFDSTMEQLPIAFQNSERKFFQHQGRDAGSLMLTFDVNGVKLTELFYVINDDSQTWLITFATNQSELDERLKEFETIFNSIEISEN